MIRDKKMLEEELRTLKQSYHELLEANIKLADEKRWALEDKERILRKITMISESIEKEPIKKEIIKQIIENDFYD